MKKLTALILIATTGVCLAACSRSDDNEATVAATATTVSETPVEAVTVSSPVYTVQDFIGTWKYENSEFVLYIRNNQGQNTWEMRHEDGRSYLSGTFTQDGDSIQLYETSGAGVGTPADASVAGVTASAALASTESSAASTTSSAAVSQYLKLTLNTEGNLIDSQGAILAPYTATTHALQDYLDYWENDDAACIMYFAADGTWTQYDLSGNQLDSGNYIFDTNGLTVQDLYGNDLNTYYMYQNDTLTNTNDRVFTRTTAPDTTAATSSAAEETDTTSDETGTDSEGTSDSSSSSAPFYYYDSDGDVWYQDEYGNDSFIGNGSDVYIDGDGNLGFVDSSSSEDESYTDSNQ